MDKKKLLTWSLSGLLVIIILSMMFGGSSSTGNKDNKKSTESSKQIDKKQEQLDALNKWYKNEYKEENPYFDEKHNAFAGFEVSGGNDLLASFYKTEMDKDNISRKEAGDYALIAVLGFYTGDLSSFDNIKNGTLATEKATNSDRYVQYYVK